MATLAQHLQNKGIRLVDPFEEHRQATATVATSTAPIAEAVAVEEEEDAISYTSSESEYFM